MPPRRPSPGLTWQDTRRKYFLFIFLLLFSCLHEAGPHRPHAHFRERFPPEQVAQAKRGVNSLKYVRPDKPIAEVGSTGCPQGVGKGRRNCRGLFAPLGQSTKVGCQGCLFGRISLRFPLRSLACQAALRVLKSPRITLNRPAPKRPPAQSGCFQSAFGRSVASFERTKRSIDYDTRFHNRCQVSCTSRVRQNLWQTGAGVARASCPCRISRAGSPCHGHATGGGDTLLVLDEMEHRNR